MVDLDGLLLFRSQGSRRLIAFDPITRSVVWERPVPPDSALVSIDRDHYYMLGEELMAIGRDQRELKWSRLLTRDMRESGIAVTMDQVLLATGGSLVSIDKLTGDTVRKTAVPEFQEGGMTVAMTRSGEILLVGVSTIAMLSHEP
jgi:hypothetical protein